MLPMTQPHGGMRTKAQFLVKETQPIIAVLCASSYSQTDLDHGGDWLIGWSEVEQTAIK